LELWASGALRDVGRGRSTALVVYASWGPLCWGTSWECCSVTALVSGPGPVLVLVLALVLMPPRVSVAAHVLVPARVKVSVQSSEDMMELGVVR